MCMTNIGISAQISLHGHKTGTPCSSQKAMLKVWLGTDQGLWYSKNPKGTANSHFRPGLHKNAFYSTSIILFQIIWDKQFIVQMLHKCTHVCRSACICVCVCVCVHVHAEHMGTVNLWSRTTEVLIDRWTGSKVRLHTQLLEAKQVVCTSKG